MPQNFILFQVTTFSPYHRRNCIVYEENSYVITTDISYWLITIPRLALIQLYKFVIFELMSSVYL